MHLGRPRAMLSQSIFHEPWRFATDQQFVSWSSLAIGMNFVAAASLSLVFLLLGSSAGAFVQDPTLQPSENVTTWNLTDALAQPSPPIVTSGAFVIDESCCEEVADGKSVGETKKFPTASVTGFFHLDSGWFSQDELNRATLGDINDGLGFRRARLAAKGFVPTILSTSLNSTLRKARQDSSTSGCRLTERDWAMFEWVDSVSHLVCQN